MQEKKFSGASLEKALKDGSFAQSGTVIIGMVKCSEQEGYIQFTKAGCNNWVELAIDMIDKAHHIGNSTCKDHSHPLFKITLQVFKNPHEQVLAGLLEQEAIQPIQPNYPSLDAAYLRQRPNFNNYGQNCYYDCMDWHIGHGDTDIPSVKRHCENKCRVSMPDGEYVYYRPRFSSRYF